MAATCAMPVPIEPAPSTPTEVCAPSDRSVIGSSAREARLALLEKRPHPFREIGRPAGFALQLGFDLELRVEIVRKRLIECALRQPEPARRLCSKPTSNAARLVEQP